MQQNKDTKKLYWLLRWSYLEIKYILVLNWNNLKQNETAQS